MAFPEYAAEDIERFCNINKKEELTLLQFDICDFYASTTEDLLIADINLAKNSRHISDQKVNKNVTVTDSIRQWKSMN